MPDPHAEARRLMVEQQLRRRGIADPRVLRAMEDIPRHRFAREASPRLGYGDHPLAIGAGQTISQPYMVALMTEALALQGDERVLEIGTGSGYQTAVLAALAADVFTVERIAPLARSAGELLDELGCANVRFRVGDGTQGWEEHAPYDRVIVTAGAPRVPPALEAQLAEGGVLVIPVGSTLTQDLLCIRKRGGKLARTCLTQCIFVKLLGQEGWSE
jgi:protein-L-isoaspartate(D-aspartate) O-methyltransferase